MQKDRDDSSSNFTAAKNAALSQIAPYLLSAALMFFAMVFGLAGNIIFSILLLVASVLLLFLQSISATLRTIRTGQKSSVKLQSQRQSLRGTIYGHLMRVRFFENTVKRMRQTELSGAISSGTLAGSTGTSKNILMLFAASIILSVLVSAIGPLLMSVPYFLAVWILPVIVWFYPNISNALKASEMSSHYNAEFAYFLSYLQICVTNGMGIFDAVDRLVGKNILTSMEHDGRMLQKWIRKDGYAESAAVNQLAQNHSHDKFRRFLFSYYDISQSRPAGLENYVSQCAKDEFDIISARDRKILGKISSTFVYGAMAMIMAPVMMLTMLFMHSDEATIRLITYAIFGIPVLFAMYVLVTGGRHSDAILHPIRISVLGLAAGLVWYVAFSDVLASVALSVSVMCLWNGRHVSRQISAWRSKADGFPVFVRDLIERCKVDSNFVVSVENIIDSKNAKKKYGSFSEILSSIRKRMYEITDRERDLFYDGAVESKRMRLLMFVLQTVFDGGHRRSISLLEQLHEFSVNLNRLKNTIDDQLAVSSLLLYIATPAFFVATLGLSVVLMSFVADIPDASSSSAISGHAGSELFVRPDFSLILESLKPAVLIMSVCSGIVISRTAYYSIHASMPVGICLGMAFVIIAGWDIFFDVISSVASF